MSRCCFFILVHSHNRSYIHTAFIVGTIHSVMNIINDLIKQIAGLFLSNPTLVLFLQYIHHNYRKYIAVPIKMNAIPHRMCSSL